MVEATFVVAAEDATEAMLEHDLRGPDGRFVLHLCSGPIEDCVVAWPGRTVIHADELRPVRKHTLIGGTTALPNTADFDARTVAANPPPLPPPSAPPPESSGGGVKILEAVDTDDK
eukprot:12212224-Heterocapsa_arctica.AAC.1